MFNKRACPLFSVRILSSTHPWYHDNQLRFACAVAEAAALWEIDLVIACQDLRRMAQKSVTYSEAAEINQFQSIEIKVVRFWYFR